MPACPASTHPCLPAQPPPTRACLPSLQPKEGCGESRQWQQQSVWLTLLQAYDDKLEGLRPKQLTRTVLQVHQQATCSILHRRVVGHVNVVDETSTVVGM